MGTNWRDERLRAVILRKFRTFSDFAQAVGEHNSYISCVVNRRRKLTAERAAKWAATLDCKPGDLEK